MTESLLLLIAFFLVALLYASVGHGGASGYLAILVLAGFSRPAIAPIVLALNILVTMLGWFYFRRAGHFSFQLLSPFIVSSIPAAFLGAQIHLSSRAFSMLLAAVLFAAAIRMLFVSSPYRPVHSLSPSLLWKVGPPIGFLLGFLSGLTGIGGGIFLSPILLLLGWADPKLTAGTSAAFIVVNSLAGLLPHLFRGGGEWSLFGPLGLSVFLGGLIGARSGAFRLPPHLLQRLLGVVLLLAAVKLSLDLLF